MAPTRQARAARVKRRGTLKTSVVVPLLLASWPHPGSKAATFPDPVLAADLQLARNRRIYFGHQSVGGNIIEGLRELGEPRLNIVVFNGAALPGGGVFAESGIGSNGQPNSKCDAFRRTVSLLAAGSLDVALMKFCYVDFTRATNVRQVFRYYESTIESLRTKYPEVIFVHVTAPLVARPPAWKTAAKTLLGRGGDPTDMENSLRCEFNTLLVSRYQGEPVFDLAKVESTFADGARSTFDVDGSTGFSLICDYTDDGGHLNKAGRKAAAAELVRIIAGAIRARAREGRR